MASAVLVLGVEPGSPQAVELAGALRERGHDAIVLPVGRGTLGIVRAAGRGRRALKARPAAAVITISPLAHVAARLLGGRRPRWLAHVGAPIPLPGNRWLRAVDPRARALRRADTVTVAPDAADHLHRSAGAAARPAAGATDVATAALERPSLARPGGLRILMLGTPNTPHVEHMALAMRERGHEVVVGGDLTPAYAPSVLPAAGVDVRPLELPAMPWVRRLYREFRPDVVHANWLPAYGFLAALMRLRPLVVMAWGSDVYHADRRQARRSRFALRHAAVAMSDSADLIGRMVQLGADPARTHVLNWGVDLTRFSPPADRAAVRRELGLGEASVVLGPRALTVLYNPAVIVEGFERAAVPGAQLVLKHIGTDEPAIGRPLPAEARVIGHVPYEQLPDYYRAASVCVSIPDSDSSPRSVWEAMACGCPCVLSDLPWVHELIEDGRHALVVDPEPDAVAAAIRRLLTEPDLAERIASEARALVLAHRDQREEMDRLSGLYRSVARGRAR